MVWKVEKGDCSSKLSSILRRDCRSRRFDVLSELKTRCVCEIRKQFENKLKLEMTVSRTSLFRFNPILSRDRLFIDSPAMSSRRFPKSFDLASCEGQQKSNRNLAEINDEVQVFYSSINLAFLQVDASTVTTSYSTHDTTSKTSSNCSTYSSSCSKHRTVSTFSLSIIESNSFTSNSTS